MKTLIVSISKDYPIDTGRNIIVLKYDLLNDIMYELGAELAFKIKDDSIGDKTKIITDISDSRPEDYTEIVDKIKSGIIAKLFLANVPEESSIVFPDSYTDWMVYNSNLAYAEIGRKLRANNNKVTISLTDVWEDYIQSKVLPRVEDIVKSDTSVNRFTIEGVNNPDSQLARAINCFRDNLEFEAYDSGGVQFEIGEAYNSGLGVEKNLEEAFKYYLAAAEKRHSVAANWIGWCYQNGLGVKPDDSKALMWYNIGAELGNKNAQANAAFFYETGKGTAIDLNKAVDLYERSLSDNNNIGFALVNVANIFYGGKLGVPDYPKAYRYYNRAASTHGTSETIPYIIGYMLYHGQGVEKNDKESLRMLNRALRAGVRDAYYLAGVLYAAGAGSDFGNPDIDKAIELFGEGAKDDLKCAWQYAKLSMQDNRPLDKWKWAIDKAVDAGNNEAAFEFAKYIYDNKIKDIDRKRPMELLGCLVEKGYDGASELLNLYREEEKEDRRREEENRRREEENRRRKEEDRRRKEEEEARQRIRYKGEFNLYQKVLNFTEAMFTRNARFSDPDNLRVLVDGARSGIPLAKAVLGANLLQYDPNNKQAAELLLSSINEDAKSQQFFGKVSEYCRANKIGDARYPELCSNSGIEAVCYTIVGSCYFAGLGLEKDLKKAVYYIRKSVPDNCTAWSSNFYGQYWCGLLYWRGEGVPKDDSRADVYLMSAAGSRFNTAKFQYAVFLSQRDESKGWSIIDKLVNEAAAGGDIKACVQCAKNLIKQGRRADAEKWLHKAIENSFSSFASWGANTINTCCTMLREIGGLEMEPTFRPVNVYFDDEGPTLIKPEPKPEPEPTYDAKRSASAEDKEEDRALDDDASLRLKRAFGSVFGAMKDVAGETMRKAAEQLAEEFDDRQEDKGGLFRSFFGRKRRK